MTWLNKVKKPQPTNLISVIDRPKGFILVGESWDFFAWTDSKQYIQIQNAITKAVSSEDKVPVLVMNPTKDGKVKLTVHESLKTTWKVQGSKFLTDLVESDDDEPDELF